MQLRTLLAFIKAPNFAVQMKLLRDLEQFIRINYLYAAIESGLLEALKTPATKEELVVKLGIIRTDFLELLLEMGVTLKELSREGDHYRITGKRSRAIISESGDPLAAFIQESVSYHGSVYQHLATRMRGGELGNYLEETGTLIARSSRMLEPLMRDFVYNIVRSYRPESILEIGCGSGIYLKYAAEANPRLKGLGIDMQESVVRHANDNLSSWGLHDRFKVVSTDIRNPSGHLGGPFDIVTLYNNLYYFNPEERPSLFRSIKSRLALNGIFALVSLMYGKSLSSLNFNLVLRSTVGCAALPDLEQTVAQLRESGFTNIQKISIMPSEHFYGIVAG